MLAVLCAIEAESVDGDMRAAEAWRIRRQVKLGFRAVRRNEVGLTRFAAHALALDGHLAPLGAGAKSLLFQIGLLHEPMRQAAQQVEVWPAAVIAARPKPHLVAQQQPHAPPVDSRQHKERLVVRAAHYRHAAGWL